LKELVYEKVKGTRASQAIVKIDGNSIEAKFSNEENRYTLRFPQSLNLNSAQSLVVSFS
jgi:hypothetical protein